MRLLLVEDTEDVAEAIAARFARSGTAVDCAGTLNAARGFLEVQTYDMIVLDINMPDGSGTELLRGIRGNGHRTPVLMLTAEFGIETRIEALDDGADDYLVKPFDLRELEARVRALVRRDKGEKTRAIAFGPLTFDIAGNSLHMNGVVIDLTRRELALMRVLMSNRGRVIAKERIFDQMFSFDESDVGLNAIEIYVGRVRKKIAGSGVSIRTLRGLGYQLVNDG
ncbi:response regulator transcription factor [Roseibium sp. RKSG952]|uniref:response regulator transcription factor n=1 Tax=Roseibium sp. RKSG952 TaxID=2529384 RepID=UPI0012BD779F|nr:response regulator transcription factor [Roseibium sp. RKSG952]MTH96526.1 response regulator transcription factor [Roseibium sp. RKSG952]